MAAKKEITEDMLLVGDRVDIVSEDGQVYRSMIEDRLNDGPFLVSVPHRKGRYMYVSKDDVIYVVFYREGGRYIAQMKVLALEKRGAIRYMWLLQETRAQRNQRREAYRLPVSMGIVVYNYDEKFTRLCEDMPGEQEEEQEEDAFTVENLTVMETVLSRDISIKGVAISSKKTYTIGDKYIVGMDLENSAEIIGGIVRMKKTPALILQSVVRRCVPMNENKINHVGLAFLDETKKVSEQIARFVLIEQQKQIKNQRRLK
ncbi:MAG: flagellar brake protein [Oscillospiraceae bacterium]|nr:flagellar brake protein [Oscillospiraceae bacterium]